MDFEANIFIMEGTVTNSRSHLCLYRQIAAPFRRNHSKDKFSSGRHACHFEANTSMRIFYFRGPVRYRSRQA